PKSNPWEPFDDREGFELAEFFFTDAKMSKRRITRLQKLWAARHGGDSPYLDASHMYKVIDSARLGDVKWDCFDVDYRGEKPPGTVPDWMSKKYEVWYRNPLEVARQMLSNKDFDKEIDYSAKRVFKDGIRQWQDFMSGNWAWEQSTIIAKDPETHGAMFIPIILGSDKTTVSVGTGDNEFYPLYMMLGNHHNAVRHAHRNAVALIGFLAIPKTTRQYKDSVQFRKFRQQLFHVSLARILKSLKPGMTKPEITSCTDGNFRRAIYGLASYIADYPEQALLACIVQGWCPKCLAKSSELGADGPWPPRRCEHVEELIKSFGLGTLWDKYGI
ncbi:hypothetical protein OE88DRAFT_1605474, partial [Heliocybe sulcata]